MERKERRTEAVKGGIGSKRLGPEAGLTEETEHCASCSRKQNWGDRCQMNFWGNAPM